jgi:serine/threonine-protein kinase RsbW
VVKWSSASLEVLDRLELVPVAIGFSVRLPVDAHSIPFVRGICRQALEHLQVDGLVVDEVALALSEACADVVQHVGTEQDYEVQVQIDGDRCRISVCDDGGGFDAEAQVGGGPTSLLEGGQGLLLMRALVDSLEFSADADGRHRVTLVKALGVRPAVPAG